MNVVMFHSVGNENSSWSRNWLSTSLEHFESFCNYLQRKNYNTLFLDEWYDLQNNPRLIKKNHIVLTFDDGYLDNWVYAFPILKKYGLKATIFINPEFVDPSSTLRPTLEDIWNGKYNIEELQTLGFLNWEEIKFMYNSGLIDIQSHSMSHNFYFHSDKLIDYYEGQDDYHWLPWLEKPDRKPFWISENQKDFVPVGHPVFKYGRALGLRRFFPSKKFVDSFILQYHKLKNNKPNIKEQLMSFTETYRRENNRLGRYESDEELERRYRYEVYESKRILEEILNKPVEYLCWPGGGYNDRSIRMSVDAGYKASTIPSWEKHKLLDNSKPYKRIRRLGIGSYYKFNNKYKYSHNRLHLIYTFLSKSGNTYYRNLLRLKKYYHVISDKAQIR